MLKRVSISLLTYLFMLQPIYGSNIPYNQAQTTLPIYTLPSSVSNFSDWKTAITYCMDNLIESLTLTIPNYNDNIYNLNKLTLVNASIKMNGTKLQNTATVTYTFIYKENYKLIKASENINYFSKLTLAEKNIYNTVKSIAQNITYGLYNEYEKEKALHDYLVSEYKYDTSLAPLSHNISSFIQSKKGVCEAYAYTFKMLCDFSGIESKIVIGSLNGSPHAWNMVKLDNEWYHIDVTSDDPIPDNGNNIEYDYFNISDNMLIKTHSWDISSVPSCNSLKYNYYYYNNFVMYDMAHLEYFIKQAISQRKTTLKFYTQDFYISVNTIKDFFDSRYVSSYSLSQNEANLGSYTLKINYR